jgi:hypothetical protein
MFFSVNSTFLRLYFCFSASSRSSSDWKRRVFVWEQTTCYTQGAERALPEASARHQQKCHDALRMLQEQTRGLRSAVHLQQLCVCVCVCVCVYVYAAAVCMYIHLHTHTYTHTYTHAQMLTQGALDMPAWEGRALHTRKMCADFLVYVLRCSGVLSSTLTLYITQYCQLTIARELKL